jgi:FKBP-type peptidyl-prolyl cis-trans isomerase FklB
MKRFAVAALCVALALAGTTFTAHAQSLKTEKDKVSYSIGMDLGSNLKKQDIEIDPDVLAKGLKDSYRGGPTALTSDEAHQVITEFRKVMMAKQAERMKKLAEQNQKEGEKFLAENAKKPGVKTLPSGLQYKVLTPGTGKTPKATDTVTVNYKGSLINGTEFDSSFKRGQPATFPVSGVIPGWTEGLQLMKEGAKYEFFIPPKLAYGERGAGREIGPNATLIFEVTLLSVK